MPKPKGKTRIKVGLTVQLKNDISSVGEVTGKGDGKASWKVRWTAGRLQGTITAQSSMSLRLWQLDLLTLPVSDSSSSEEEDAEVDVTGVDYVRQKRQFDSHAKSLIGQKVRVSQFPFVPSSIFYSATFFLDCRQKWLV
jgi:hypothetical protein